MLEHGAAHTKPLENSLKSFIMGKSSKRSLMNHLTAKLGEQQFAQAARLDNAVRSNLKELGYES